MCSVWLQILSRDQKQSSVLKLHLSNLEIEILWEETSATWINITDVYYFMQTSTTEHVQMIWSSEKDNGYRHLYLVDKPRHQPHSTITPLTQGDWCCIDRPLYIDESKSLVYFSAKLHTPLESHFYVLNYTTKSPPKLLTRLGFSHTVTMNSPDYFVDCFSTLHDPQVMMVQRLDHTKLAADRFGLLMPVALKRQVETPPSPPTSILNHVPLSNNFFSYYHQEPPTKYQDCVEPNGEIFSFHTSDGKASLH